LKLPKKDYTIDSFLEEISNNADQYFEDSRERKWLKTFLLYAQSDWLSSFEKFNPEKNGDLYYFMIPNVKEVNNPTEYYATKFADGLIMIFTFETQFDYTKTLEHHINRKRGITQMWIKPKVFKQIKDYIIEKHDGYITSFIAKRSWSTDVPARYREQINRNIHYFGEDGNESIKELEYLYGVVPTIIDFKIGSDPMRITNEGLFVIHSLELRKIRIVLEIVNNILVEQMRIHKISTSIESHLKKIELGNESINVRQLESGRITFGRPLDTILIRKLFGDVSQFDIGRSEANIDFAFIDKDINDKKGLLYSATVIDKLKGTVFGVTGTKNEMICVPMHRTTFESFIRFYKLASESLDSSSQLGIFSDPIVTK